jgi:alkylation response protein AidB-like acyl-CoA dehydrogenase
MDLTVTPEMDALREVVASFFERKSPMESVRTNLDDPDAGGAAAFDPAVWQQLAEQVGAPGLLIAEEFGGQGSSLREMAIVLEESARRLWGGPLLASSVLATVALVEGAGAVAHKQWLPQLADGSLTAALVIPADRDPARSGPGVSAIIGAGGEYRLTGEVGNVIGGTAAGLLVVPVDVEGRTDLVVVDPSAAGVTVEPLPAIDLTRRLAKVSFADTAATVAGTDAADAVTQALAAGAVAVGADQLGLLRAMTAMAVEYAGLRTQFGVPIGSFQAVAHLCVDLFVAQESTAALVGAAAAAGAEAGGSRTALAEAVLTAQVLQAYASEATVRAGETALHIHGGIGFTWEHDIHLFLRRAKLDEELFGSSTVHRDALAAALELV